MKKIIGVIYGGDSSEVVVSHKSALGVQSFIDSTRYRIVPILITNNNWAAQIDGVEYPIDKNDFSFTVKGERVVVDFAYITIHGTPGEDGKLQGYFDLIGIKHSTCGVLPAAITFNKFVCNNYLRGFGVQVADSVLLRIGNSFSAEEIIAKVGLPCFVKPNAGGSSFGVSKVKSIDAFNVAVEKAFKESDEVVVEQFIKGTELTCGLYKIKGKEVVFPITEVISKNEFFDYEAKYTASMAEEITPARISDSATQRIQKIASLVYDILGCKGIIRIDFFLSEDKIYLLEVNTTPGMTTTSFIPQQIKAAGIDIKEVFTDIIESNL
ncbi:MAG: D-alanine--D-alanine ligase [Breznakibacter sp.]|nr:D-alanine--D-alanine ligase [Breznakibacter sp.]